LASHNDLERVTNHLPLGTYHLRPYDPLLDENGDLVPGSPRPLGVYLGQRTQVTRDPEPNE